MGSDDTRGPSPEDERLRAEIEHLRLDLEAGARAPPAPAEVRRRIDLIADLFLDAADPAAAAAARAAHDPA